jgi:5-methylcytosine-specific restriction endonuclease McrA
MTEEERKARDRESKRKWREANAEKKQESDRQYREANREKERERGRLYREANHETKLESQRRYREANHEKLLGKQRHYNETNQEKRRQYDETHRQAAIERTKQWCKANPEKARENSLQSVNNRRARKHGALDPCAPVTASATRQRVWLFGNACAYCGSDGPLHLDHVEPLARGGRHVPDNLVPACNRSKLAKPVEAWYLSQPFFSAERWETLQAHTGRSWSDAEQLSLMSLLSA